MTDAPVLSHYLAAIAYRARKALRDAPASFGNVRVSRGVRTPRELVRHMASVLGYAQGASSEAPIAQTRSRASRMRSRASTRCWSPYASTWRAKSSWPRRWRMSQQVAERLRIRLVSERPREAAANPNTRAISRKKT